MLGDGTRCRLRTGLALALVALPMAAFAQSAGRPYFAQAQVAFETMAARQRNEAFLELMATGDYNAMASGRFGPRIYDATASFQAENGVAESGVLTAETRAALSAVGGPIINSWRLQFVDHPLAPAAIVVPNRFGLVRSSTARGLAFENRNHTMSVDFSFFGAGDASLADVFTRLTQPTPGRRTDFTVLQPTFFAVAGGTATTSHYTRFIVVEGGIAGFTLSWNLGAYPNGGRIAVVMANELYPRHMVSNDGATPDMLDAMPGDHGDAASPNLMAESRAPLNAGSEALSEQALRSNEELKQKAEAARAAQQALAQQAEEERARIAQQQEDDRRIRLAAERAAREAAAARLKSERLVGVSAAAKSKLDEAAGFVKANRDNPHLLDHLQRIADVTTVLSGTEPEPIERKTAALTAELAADPIYVAYAAQQAVERKRETERSLVDATRALTLQKTFLIGAVAQDPVAPAAATLLRLARQADATLAKPELAATQTLVGTIDAAIANAELASSFAAARAEAEKASSANGLTQSSAAQVSLPSKAAQ